ATGVLDLERGLERVLVVGIDLELDVLFLDPGAVGADVQPRVLVRHLLDADHDLHGPGASSGARECGAWRPASEKSRRTLTDAVGRCKPDRESKNRRGTRAWPRSPGRAQ